MLIALSRHHPNVSDHGGQMLNASVNQRNRHGSSKTPHERGYLASICGTLLSSQGAVAHRARLRCRPFPGRLATLPARQRFGQIRPRAYPTESSRRGSRCASPNRPNCRPRGCRRPGLPCEEVRLYADPWGRSNPGQPFGRDLGHPSTRTPARVRRPLLSTRKRPWRSSLAGGQNASSSTLTLFT